MASLPYLGVMDIPLRYGYTLPNFPATLTLRGFSNNARDAVVGIARGTSVFIFLCRHDGWVQFVTPNSQTFTGNSWQCGIIVNDPLFSNRFELVFMLGEESDPEGYYSYKYNVVGQPSPTGLIRTIDATAKNFFSKQSGTNGTNEMGPYRTGNKLWTWHVRGLSSGTSKYIYDSDFNLIADVPLAWTSVQMIQNFNQSGGGGGVAVINFLDGWRMVRMNTGAPADLVTFADGSASIDTLTLEPDGFGSETLFTTLNNQGTGCLRAIAQFGYCLTFGSPVPTPLFSGMGSRIIYWDKANAGYYNVRLTALDSRAAAVLAENSGTLTMGSDGYWFYKRNSTALPLDQDILISPEPPRQILPYIVPMGGLPRYGVYDKPYGVER